MNIDLQAREITPLRNTFAHVAKYIGDEKAASRYQEATFGAQPMTNFHYRPTWDPAHEIFDASRSRVQLDRLVRAEGPAPVLLRQLDHDPRTAARRGGVELPVRRISAAWWP